MSGIDAFLGDAMDADGDQLGGARVTHEVGPLQRALSAVVDFALERVWGEVLWSERRWADVRRLKELRDSKNQKRVAKTCRRSSKSITCSTHP